MPQITYEPRRTFVGAKLVGAQWVRLLQAMPSRQALLVQNLSGSCFLEIQVTKGNPAATQIPPTGSLFADFGLEGEVWARNITNSDELTVTLFDVTGVDYTNRCILDALNQVIVAVEGLNATMQRRG